MPADVGQSLEPFQRPTAARQWQLIETCVNQRPQAPT
jgi:hypothetical protein